MRLFIAVNYSIIHINEYLYTEVETDTLSLIHIYTKKNTQVGSVIGKVTLKDYSKRGITYLSV